jgi:urate oxidase
MISDENSSPDDRTMNYGKENVSVYRTYATPLKGVRTIPESSFDGRKNILFGADIRMQVEGEAFLPSFSEGDNSMVVATDSMKNFMYHHMGEYDGATLEGLIEYIGSEILETYSQMEAVTMSADQLTFDEKAIPNDGEFIPSDVVFGVSDGPSGYAELRVNETEDGTTITEHTSGVTGIELVKVKDNSFTGYVQDEYTTLPERENRTLYVGLDIFWTYEDDSAALGSKPEEYVPAEQVADIAQVVFDDMDVNSIQELIYQIGLRILKRFPQLTSVRFEANNRTWIGVRDDDLAGDGKVLREPPAPTGFQQFSMDRSDLERSEE